MKSIHRISLAIVLSLVAISFFIWGFADEASTYTSPDGAVQLKTFTEKGQLAYSVLFNGKPVIEKSPMVISINGVNITNGVNQGEVTENQVEKTYPLYGDHSTAINKYNGASVSLEHPESGVKYNLEVRLFNDAVAFRWIVPGNEGKERIPDEATEFRIPDGSTLWHHNLRMHYEGVHDKDKIGDLEKGTWAAPPVTFKLPGDRGYASITEANLVSYSGMALQAGGENALTLRLAQHQPISYPYELRYSKEDIKRVSQPASIAGTITTPWRVVMVGADLNTLVNSDAVHNLNPAPDKKLFPDGIYTEWVRPGRAVWKYLDGGGEGTLENMKRFSRKAGELGFEYNVLEGFWDEWSDDEIKELVDYSRERGVGIIVWKHSKELRDPRAREQFFKYCHDLGIAGVKIDFFDDSAKEVINLYTDILQEAAKYELVVNFHGSNKPTGWSRTWPNQLAVESVKGMESSSLEDRATHTVTVPFTRYLSGPADYTPVHFGERRRNTTWANQIASAAILGAPLLTYAAHPAALTENPAVEMIKAIPATWDETRVLPGSEIGELAAYARRKGDSWFVAVMNGVEPKTVKVPLSFLGKETYNAMLVRDAEQDTASVTVATKKHSREDTLTVELKPGGGFIGKFDPQ